MEKIKISSKRQEKLEEITEALKLAVSNDVLGNSVHVCQDSERKIVVMPLKNRVKIDIYYRNGLTNWISYFVPYSKLFKIKF